MLTLQVGQNVLDTIRKQFLSMTPLDIIISNLRNITLSEEVQKKILSATVSFQVALSYSPSKTYQKYFLKKLMTEVEKSGFEITDDLYCVYADLLSKSDNDGKPYFCSYELNSEVTIILQESKCLVNQSTTGLQTWEAGKYLIEWSIENSHLLRGRKILELGSGTGLTGIAICKLHDPASYYFTDCSSEVLQILKKNVDMNLNGDNIVTVSQPNRTSHLLFNNDSFMSSNCERIHSKKNTCRSTDCKTGDCAVNLNKTTVDGNFQSHTIFEKKLPLLSVFYLEWELADKEELSNLDAEIILAADVSYDPAIIKPFVHVLGILLNCTQRTAYVACTERNPETFKMLLQIINSSPSRLQYSILNKCESTLFFYDRSTPIQLLKITSVVK